MNKKLQITYFALFAVCTLFGCRKSENNSIESASRIVASSGQTYTVDTRQSVVEWKGSMLAGANSHSGFVYLSKGEITIDNGKIAGGSVDVAMHTIEDESHKSNSGLINHLKDPDFFDVAKFPYAGFEFSNPANATNNGNVAGKLTIKGIAHPVAFPAKVEENGGTLRLDGRLAIDRTKWGIVYKSGKFYDLLADETMSDSIEFHIKIVAIRQPR